MGLNLDLVKMAKARQKRAFVPAPGGAMPADPAAMGGMPPGGAPPMDPSMMVMPPGGAPPMDPAMMGGMPPGGAPPMDPSMMGMPPMDPAMMGGMPPPPPPPPDPAAGGGGGGGDIRSAIRDELSAAGLLPQGGGKGGKAPKPDINTIATDVFQLKKMFLHFLRMQNIELPMDILDGPNRDPMTGAPATAESGGSDVTPGASQVQSAIPPISPIQGAFPTPPGGDVGGGGEKAAAANIGTPVDHKKIMSKAAAVALMLRRKKA